MVEELSDVLKTAQNAYLAEDYPRAIRVYDIAKNIGEGNPYLALSQGNAYFKNSDYGKAIHSYFMARKAIPRTKELNNNLSMVLDKTRLSQPPLLSYSYMTWVEAFILALVFNLLFLFRKKLTARKTLWFSVSFAFVISLINLGYITVEQKLQKHAVVVESSIEAYSGNDEAYSMIFELFDGQIVQVIRREEDWSKVKVNNNLGWVRNNGISEEF